MPTKVIVFEGCDRVGKTTGIASLVEQCNANGISCASYALPDRSYKNWPRILELLDMEPEQQTANRVEMENLMYENLVAGTEAIRKHIDADTEEFIFVDRMTMSYYVYAYARDSVNGNASMMHLWLNKPAPPKVPVYAIYNIIDKPETILNRMRSEKGSKYKPKDKWVATILEGYEKLRAIMKGFEPVDKVELTGANGKKISVARGGFIKRF